MNVIVFGATGMVGQGVLRECLLDTAVSRVLVVGRTPLGTTHAKLREIIHPDLFDLEPLAKELTGYESCFFCLGVSSLGMSERDYAHLTYDLTLGVAQLLARLNPSMTFTYVSGQNTDSTERGPRMWARVKGKTENALLRLPFKAAFMFRPGFIQPLHGIRSKTKLYGFIYALAKPLVPFFMATFPKSATTTQQVGRAMLRVAKEGSTKTILETPDINAL